MYAEDANGVNTGWQNKGTWTAFAGTSQPPTAVSATPNSGTGSAQTFSFVFSDSSGYASIPVTEVLFGVDTGSYAPSCVVYYDQPTNALYLANDSASAWLGPISPGSGALQNSKCTVNGSGSSISGSGTTLTLNLALTFQPTFTGAKNIFLYAQDSNGLNTGWVSMGTWTAF